MKQPLSIGVKAEWDKAKEILVSTPGLELFNGVLHYESALFQSPFDTKRAYKEHEEFKRTLNENGVNVRTLRNILLEDYDTLRFLAEKSLTYIHLDSKKERQIHDLEENISSYELKEKTLNCLNPEDLMRIIIEQPRPVLVADKNDPDEYQLDHYIHNPIINHYFQRDPQIITDKGLVIGRMKNRVRKNETTITKYIFKILDIEPLHKIEKPGTLEGGDYIPAGSYALVGEGLRTNKEGISQLLRKKVFGFPEIAVVHDSFRDMEEMHLDTYFEFVAPDKALILADRITNKEKIPSVTVYQINKEGRYIQTTSKEEISFPEYLKSKGVQLIEISKEMQLNYGINILTLSENNIISVEGVHQDYISLLKDHGINVIQIDATNLTKGYGGPHCMTQVLRREPL